MKRLLFLSVFSIHTIREKLHRGDYDRITDPAQFAETLGNDLRAISKDKHLNVGFTPGGMPPAAQQRHPGKSEGARVTITVDGTGKITDVQLQPVTIQ